MKTTTLFAVILLSVLAFSNISTAQTTDASTDAAIDAYINSLRADWRADKVALITDNMQFTDQESKIFWPVYKKYEADLTKVNDQRVELIKSYADKYKTMTDADAKSMIDQSLDFESRRIDVKKKYAKEFQKAGLSSLTVARFLQLEHRLDLLVDLKIASDLPPLLNKPAGASATQK